ncbi:hypothetical protein EJ02DRAFT_461138 [Clathrospora elynae]|uniref:Uncharacterized protein n=1 Tax=Clathrospora elynae TaxID=706981 RepID=A0A6A5S4V6_9PLEO|nr:hypothetical protein EJ02DRAFT_461138 [Clathrospora elynae]
MGFPCTSCQSALSRQKSREDLKRKLDDIDAKDSDNSYELRSSVLPRKGKFAAPESLPVPATPLNLPLCINCALVMHEDGEDCVMPPGKRACTRCSDHLHEACRAIPDELKADVVSLCQLLSSIQSLAKKVAPKLRAAQKKAAQAGACSGYQDNRDGDSAVEGLLRQILHELVALREDVGKRDNNVRSAAFDIVQAIEGLVPAPIGAQPVSAEEDVGGGDSGTQPE